MKDVKKVNRQFAFTLVMIVVSLAVGLIILYLAGRYLTNYFLTWTIFFSELLIFIFLVSYFRTRMWGIINLSYQIKIRHNASEPLTINRIVNRESLNRYMTNNNYILFSQDEIHRLYYRADKDMVKKIFRGYMLEVVVYIEPSQEEFYLDIVDAEVQKIQDILLKDKKKCEKILITQLKQVSELNDRTKELIKENIFFRTQTVMFLRAQSGVVSTINVGLHYDSGKAILLYSDTYSPSLYYTHQIEEIKRMI